MTMLDRMRRHKNWLKWSLAIVVVAFVLLYIPNFLRDGGRAAAPATARWSRPSTDRRSPSPSSAAIYQQQMQAYRRVLRRPASTSGC